MEKEATHLHFSYKYSIVKTTPYCYTLHAHRFAVWTAARAVNRDFAGTNLIQEAIEATGLPEKLEQLVNQANLEPALYDKFHKDAVNAIVEHLSSKLGADAHKASYGRAAKIVAIYIKTIFVIPDPTSTISKLAHPPIDSILLKNLSKEYKDLKVAHIRWTKLDEADYFSLIDSLRKRLELENFWELEKYWVPS
ncbi:hypothetical protein ACSX1A_03215 [Pontibacter sp. MBLB2868]|uniref:hypothetical protein n=1 Tax=Pontibacter sp. MBLB2868 TaxID=3451555 RepID=UPI003F753A9C